MRNNWEHTHTHCKKKKKEKKPGRRNSKETHLQACINHEPEL